MSRKQIVLLFAANAIISALVSIVVVAAAVLLMRDRLSIGRAQTPTVAETVAHATGTSALPTPTPIIHIVKAGDTISGLALTYDVPAENIIAANQLENPNFLRVGMELIIPVGGIPNATATFTPEPTPTETPIPFLPPSADMTATAAAEAGATITPLPTPLPLSGEIQIEITEVLGAGQPGQELVRITNTGERNVDMSGWTLSDDEGNTYPFSGLTLWKGGSVSLHTGTGMDNPPSDFYWGKLQAVFSPGEQITLKDASGQVIATYVVGR